MHELRSDFRRILTDKLFYKINSTVSILKIAVIAMRGTFITMVEELLTEAMKYAREREIRPLQTLLEDWRKHQPTARRSRRFSAQSSPPRPNRTDPEKP